MPLHTTGAGHGRESAPRVFFYVQHLLGTGHIRRATLLADAMKRMGMDIYVVSGGMTSVRVHGDIATVQLPPLRAKDHSFTALVDEAGHEPDKKWLNARCRLLLDQFMEIEPDIVVLESFPFGRRKLRFELLPLLEEIHRARPKPLVVCSVRDIVQARKPERVAETVGLLLDRFDHVMVHGDPDFVRLGDSFPAADRIAELIRYTGYVASLPPKHRSDTGHNEVLVSGGGGAVSERLLTTAIEAHTLSESDGSRWRILAGPNIDNNVFDKLRARASSRLVVERNRDDFPILLGNCSVSVSQCGYNTVIDLLQSCARSIVVPFEGDGETEQLLRARKLSERGLVDIVTEDDLSPGILAASIDRLSSAPKPEPSSLDLNGATGSARFLLDTWRKDL